MSKIPRQLLATYAIDSAQHVFFIFGGLLDTNEDVTRLEEMMDRYIHLRQQARNAFELRYEASVAPDADPWELCARVLSRQDIVAKMSEPW